MTDVFTITVRGRTLAEVRDAVAELALALGMDRVSTLSEVPAVVGVTPEGDGELGIEAVVAVAAPLDGPQEPAKRGRGRPRKEAQAPVADLAVLAEAAPELVQDMTPEEAKAEALRRAYAWFVLFPEKAGQLQQLVATLGAKQSQDVAPERGHEFLAGVRLLEAGAVEPEVA